ncbi:histidine kinase dimerization/phosphoacceptor domain -containing protein [Bradyrhizobium canariense]|uniref:histidine kinase dimerization/phosphoacceptor domain -containing protein n=1 Tax=Bradyrhizobium canariense TaxID=255045 RepID=UPI001FCE1702|nr:histidine kinase dimerization/phosphoacceptor domain -containing protein [Bradyrhizobium canariense]
MVQLALQMQTGAPGDFLLLLGVFVSGLIFDSGSGIFAAIIAVGVGICLSYTGSLGVDFLSTNALFAITAAGTAVIAEFQRTELRRVMLADKAKALLLQELAHRTKNNLAILGSMIHLEARHGGPELARPLDATARRLQVMAELYDHLVAEAGLALRQYALLPQRGRRKGFPVLGAFGACRVPGALRGFLAAARSSARDTRIRLSGREGGQHDGRAVGRGSNRAIGLRQRRRPFCVSRSGWIGFEDCAAPRAADRGEIRYERLDPGLRVRVWPSAR